MKTHHSKEQPRGTTGQFAKTAELGHAVELSIEAPPDPPRLEEEKPVPLEQLSTVVKKPAKKPVKKLAKKRQTRAEAEADGLAEADSLAREEIVFFHSTRAT